MQARAIRLFPFLLLLFATPQPVLALPPVWPDADSVAGVRGEPVSFPSRSPFLLTDVADPGRSPPTAAVATFFRPAEAPPGGRAPAVIMLHGSGGVLWAREMTYARQLATMGVAALVIDAFAARRDRASSFTERLLNITEAMVLADAYAGLEWLAARDDIDAARIALVGFSYGGMATLYAAQEQVARAFAPPDLRFAGHAAFYAPCIVQFEDRRTTGRPVLILMGAEDEIVDPRRCETTADELREGGAAVEMTVYPRAYHQWDGGWEGPRRIGRSLGDCRLRVYADGTVRDRNTTLPMVDSLTRKIILGLCSDSEGYLIGRDDAVRARSNADLARFLTPILGTSPE